MARYTELNDNSSETGTRPLIRRRPLTYESELDLQRGR